MHHGLKSGPKNKVDDPGVSSRLGTYLPPYPPCDMHFISRFNQVKRPPQIIRTTLAGCIPRTGLSQAHVINRPIEMYHVQSLPGSLAAAESRAKAQPDMRVGEENWVWIRCHCHDPCEGQDSNKMNLPFRSSHSVAAGYGRTRESKRTCCKGSYPGEPPPPPS